jgi:hypothetical protein
MCYGCRLQERALTDLTIGGRRAEGFKRLASPYVGCMLAITAQRPVTIAHNSCRSDHLDTEEVKGPTKRLRPLRHAMLVEGVVRMSRSLFPNEKKLDQTTWHYMTIMTA